MFLGVQLSEASQQLHLIQLSSNFSVGLMPQVFYMCEVEAVLSESREEEDDSCATLARLKMAIQYEEKKVSKTLN